MQKTKQINLKPDLGAFYAIQPGNGSAVITGIYRQDQRQQPLHQYSNIIQPWLITGWSTL